MAKETVKVTINGKTTEYPKGTTFEKIAQDNQKDYDAKIVLVSTYGKLRELNKKVNEDCEINFNTVKDIAGYKTYRRTATFIMIKAIRDIAGDSVLNKIKVEFSIGKGIYNTIIVKDVMTRKNMKNAAALDSLVKFMYDNIGNICSSNKIANTMTSAGRKISVPTVEEYLAALTESYVFYKTSRYDIKGKQHLTTGSKYYASDIGLRYFLLGSADVDMGRILENIVYLELIRRGYEVYIGKVGKAEVDFIAKRDGITEYYQVALSVWIRKHWKESLIL